MGFMSKKHKFAPTGSEPHVLSFYGLSAFCAAEDVQVSKYYSEAAAAPAAAPTKSRMPHMAMPSMPSMSLGLKKSKARLSPRGPN